MARYDEIGAGYALHRRADPRIAARIHAALGDARTVVNVGAGAGSYEPTDRAVVAIEPSEVMARQRPPHLPPAVLASAEALPLADDSADAVMAVLTLHHWDVQAGIRECLRVARDRVVIVTVDVEVMAGVWLVAEYFPEIAEQDRADFPTIAQLLEWLGPNATAEPISVPRDCTDGFLLSFWADPERVLDPAARAATSGFARLPDPVEAAGVARLEADLRSGAWDAAHRELRTLPELDAGLRLVVAGPIGDPDD